MELPRAEVVVAVHSRGQLVSHSPTLGARVHVMVDLLRGQPRIGEEAIGQKQKYGYLPRDKLLRKQGQHTSASRGVSRA